jgi:hypothetical protein
MAIDMTNIEQCKPLPTLQDILSLKGPQYSPCVTRWLKKHMEDKTTLPSIYDVVHSYTSHLYPVTTRRLGWYYPSPDEAYIDGRIGRFEGVSPKNILYLTNKNNTPSFKWVRSCEPVDDFWTGYVEKGICYLDDHSDNYHSTTKHQDDRWKYMGRLRTCNWCGS